MEELTTIKIIVCGDGAVGKTSLLDRYINNEFDDNSLMTRGIGFFSKIIKIKFKQEEYNTIFWDFGGQDQFRFMLPNFIGGAVGAILLFDLSRYSSTTGLEEWIKLLIEKGTFPILLVGTKMDLSNSNNPALDQLAKQIVEEQKRIFGYLKTSAKTNYNVKNTFESLLDHILRQIVKPGAKENSLGHFVV
ncbi:MAG: Rab family GTPase [Promethearchaeota archaeon]